MSATSAQIGAHYDSMAALYRAFWGDHIHHGLFLAGDEPPHDAQVAMIEHCWSLVSTSSAISMLDAGCGHGGTLLYLARRGSLQRGLGLTLSPAQARLARTAAARGDTGPLLEFLVADADTFAYPAAAFDLVWSMESSEHFADKARYFCNAASALQSGGRLLVAAWTGSMERERVRAVARDFLCPALQTATEYQAQIEAAGLRLLACQDLTARVVRTWEICRRRARMAAPLAPLLPAMASDFLRAIDVILEAYRSGELTYTVLAAEKPAP
jgi:tocopherol O-methyltransferase